MALHKLVFDTIDAVSMTASANVGAYLRSGETGKLVTYSSVTPNLKATKNFADGDVTVGSDTINITAHGYETGDYVQLTTTGTLPTGLSPATDYWVIRVDADNIKLAASLADAESGTAVDITAAAGGGTHTVDPQENPRSALDVNIVNKLGIDVDLSHTEDSVAIGDGTDLLAINADGSINITDNGGSLTVDAVQLDIDDLNATDDAVSSWTKDGTGNAITSTGGALDVNISNASISVTQGTSPWVVGDGGGSLTVDATDFDIRDLTHVSDSVKIGDGTDFLAVNADGSLNITDNGGSLTVDATQLDIDDLNATDDAVQAWTFDGTGNAIGSTGGSLNVNLTNTISVNDAALANSAILAVAETVSTSAAAIVDGGDELAGRKYLYVYNNGSKDVYIGQSGITTATGFPVPVGSILECRIGDAVDVYMISTNTNQDVRTLQLS